MTDIHDSLARNTFMSVGSEGKELKVERNHNIDVFLPHSRSAVWTKKSEHRVPEVTLAQVKESQKETPGTALYFASFVFIIASPPFSPLTPLLRACCSPGSRPNSIRRKFTRVRRLRNPQINLRPYFVFTSMMQNPGFIAPSMITKKSRFRNHTAALSRRRVNPDSLASRLGPELIKELESLLVPGSTEMPSFSARQKIQKQFGIDRRHIYDWYHTKGLRVSAKDSAERGERANMDLKDLRSRLKVTEHLFSTGALGNSYLR